MISVTRAGQRCQFDNKSGHLSSQLISVSFWHNIRAVKCVRSSLFCGWGRGWSPLRLPAQPDILDKGLHISDPAQNTFLLFGPSEGGCLFVDLGIRMYERTLHQILLVLRRIKCLTYCAVLITLTTLILYLVREHIADCRDLNNQPKHQLSLNKHSNVELGKAGFDATVEALPVLPASRERRGDMCEKRSIIFTKTHKTGSSTITNILLRYGETAGLDQLLYSYPSSTEYRSLADFKLMEGRLVGDIFSQHAMYNDDFLTAHIRGNPIRFTILRSPVSQFISAYSFFNKTKHYPANTFEESIKDFLRAHSQYLTKTWFCKNCQNLVNSNAIDMGFKMEGYVKSQKREDYLRDFISAADKKWDLVLITEHFDLSLVLLKRRLCLQTEDILYLKSLERIKRDTVEEPYTLARIGEIQHIDQALYDHFNATFWREVGSEEGIMEELEEFQQLNKAVQSFCVQGSKRGYHGTYENVLAPRARDNFQCLAMNTRCLPFAQHLEARDDKAVTEEQRQELRDQDTDPDSLSYDQLISLPKDSHLLELVYRIPAPGVPFYPTAPTQTPSAPTQAPSAPTQAPSAPIQAPSVHTQAVSFYPSAPIQDGASSYPSPVRSHGQAAVPLVQQGVVMHHLHPRTMMLLGILKTTKTSVGAFSQISARTVVRALAWHVVVEHIVSLFIPATLYGGATPHLIRQCAQMGSAAPDSSHKRYCRRPRIALCPTRTLLPKCLVTFVTLAPRAGEREQRFLKNSVAQSDNKCHDIGSLFSYSRCLFLTTFYACSNVFYYGIVDWPNFLLNGFHSLTNLCFENSVCF
eukprot:sb/3462182/